MKNVEHQIQKAFFKWLDLNKKRIPALELFHSIPNGGARTPIQGAILKAEGVRAGALDTQLPVARGGFIGLAIEFKAPEANPSKEQRERAERLMIEGWCVLFCWSWQSAARVTLGYMGMTELRFDCDLGAYE